MDNVNNIIEQPYINGYCDKCKNHHLLDEYEDRCRVIKLGSSTVMCVQIRRCGLFKEVKK